jgi:diaminopimelate epimerase
VAGVEFLKGHGTQNDFVLLPDPGDTLELTAGRVRALCDRRRGLGADGVLRVVAAEHVPEHAGGSAKWFMDYRNADGSIAEMCGNGVRVFARYLVEAGLAAPGRFDLATRAGVRSVEVPADAPDGSVTVHMGPARIGPPGTAVLHGVEFAGVSVDVGNPHLACATDAATVAGLDLTTAPEHDPELFPHGVNVEFVAPLAPDAVRMRVHERGVGETRSCGTGTVAAVAATLHRAGRTSGESTVEVPGGRVVVTVEPGASTLTGPAVLLAAGRLTDQWWADPA